uniref:Polymerase nucleotidyl transferase domain-containing protein n=1 Tax=viral metagenome TaxID=1070528 RepID=A0A6C0HNG5_9ZZZZ
MDISNVAHKLNAEQLIFFLKLNNILNGRLQFFGSIARKDFTIGKSDVDVQIFSENSQSDLLILSHFLQENSVDFISRFVKFKPSPLYTISGFKYTIKNPFKCDILVFDANNEDILTMQYKRAIVIPFVYLLLLKILKVCLKINLISQETFASLKRKIWNYYHNLNINDRHFKLMTETEYKLFFLEFSDKSHLIHPSCYPHSIVLYR